MPQRIQRKRTLGWRMPAGAVYVGRPTVFGNPFIIGAIADRRRFGCIEQITVTSPEHAVSLYRDWIENPHGCYITGFATVHPRLVVEQLRGKDLACWCPLEDGHGNRYPCHADVLLALANRGDA